MWNEMKRSVEFRRSSGDNLGQIQWQVSGEPIQGQVRPVETTLAVFDVATVDSNGAQAKVKGELRITSQGYEVKPSPNANISARYLTPSESFAPLPALWSEVDDRGERSSVLELLKLIDPQIKDVRIRVDAVNRSSIRLEHVTRGVVPVEGEGAGISKILLLASAALASHDGVFLIDEFDASLHVAVQPQVADFLLRAASRLRVQLFITTHSLETLDIFLDAFEATRDLFTNSTELRVLQLRKEGDQTKVENLPSDRARSMREELGLDLRRTS